MYKCRPANVTCKRITVIVRNKPKCILISVALGSVKFHDNTVTKYFIARQRRVKTRFAETHTLGRIKAFSRITKWFPRKRIRQAQERKPRRLRSLSESRCSYKRQWIRELKQYYRDQRSGRAQSEICERFGRRR